LHVLNAKEEITRLQRIKEQLRTNWNLENTAGSAENIHRIKKLSNGSEK
jgi:hypothetical protein